MPPLSDQPNPCEQLRSSGLPAIKPCQPNGSQPNYQMKPKVPCSKCQNRKGRYIQPEIPASFKPEGRYRPSAYPLESGTVYKLSYPGVEGEMMKDCKPKPSFVCDNIRPSCHPFAQDTTFRLSYTGVQGEPAISYKPVYRNMMGCGPMQSITTQRHDYVPKVGERPPPNKAVNNIYLSNAPMENATTMTLSYQPVEGERVPSCKPQSVYKKPDFKLEQDTINRLSYQPWDPMPKEDFPWKKRDQYKAPVHSMEGHTIYRCSYLPVDNYERLPSFKPMHSLNMSNIPLASATIYRESYQDNGFMPRPEPIVKRENICLSTHPMSQDTTARLSYTGVCGERAVPYKPVYRNMMGCGPMQSITTQRHDYVPKPIVPCESFKPPQTLSPSNFKMDDVTTFRASYLPNTDVPKTESFKPCAVYQKSPYPLESATINSLSYQPYTPAPKEEYPWMKKERYKQPCRTMEGTSIYRGSYMAPGNFIPEGPEDDCECEKEVPAITCATDDL